MDYRILPSSGKELTGNKFGGCYKVGVCLDKWRCFSLPEEKRLFPGGSWSALLKPPAPFLKVTPFLYVQFWTLHSSANSSKKCPFYDQGSFVLQSLCVHEMTPNALFFWNVPLGTGKVLNRFKIVWKWSSASLHCSMKILDFSHKRTPHKENACVWMKISLLAQKNSPWGKCMCIFSNGELIVQGAQPLGSQIQVRKIGLQQRVWRRIVMGLRW